MLARLNKYLLWVTSGGLLITQATATEPLSPLLQTLEKLDCAADVRAAQSVLNRLFNISPPGQEWPDEWMGEKPESPALYAGTLDIALSTLKSTAERFPELREDSERVALQWNYCDVLDEQHFQNLLLKHDTVQKVTAADDAPLKWDGFRQWGFLNPDPKDRFVPLLLDEIRLAPYAYQIFLHRVYRQHCFPHPETGLLASEEETPRELLSSRLMTGEAPSTEASPYPFRWNPSCRVAKQKPVEGPVQAAIQTGQGENKTKPVKKEKTVVTNAAKKSPPQAATKSKQNSKSATSEHLPPDVPVSPPPVIVAVADVNKDDLALGAKGNPGEDLVLDVPLDELVKRSSPPKGRVVLPTIAVTSLDNAIPVFYEDKELEAMQAEQGVSAKESVPWGQQQTLGGQQATPSSDGGKAGTQKRKKKKLRLAGSVADTISLKDGSNTLSASASWSPAPNWFVSGNASIKNGEPGYSWSAGYADWKPGTCSAQINNWGPLKPGDGLALDKAVANIGCKVKSEKLEKHKLSASGNLSIPLGGNKPSVSGTMQWNPKQNWYVRSTASIPLEGGKPSWSYGFGYADQRPGKWRIEYSNYGKNDFPGDNLGDGAITISRGWQY